MKTTESPNQRSQFALANSLLTSQNPDGGWGYGGPVSWTEPTAWAVLALHGIDDAAAAKGLQWLHAMRRPDGGWAPVAGVSESTWVGALAILAMAHCGKKIEPASVRWLLDQTGRESSWVVRLRRRLVGADNDTTSEFDGWPWFPGAAAWVMPTALTIVSLGSITAADNAAARARIAEGRRFLLSRQCADGGWNHGAPGALGYSDLSYPETTGLALVALREGTSASSLSRSIVCAKQHLKNCKSRIEGAWLQLGLLAMGCRAAELVIAFNRPPRNVCDLAVATIAERAMEGGNVLF